MLALYSAFNRVKRKKKMETVRELIDSHGVVVRVLRYNRDKYPFELFVLNAREEIIHHFSCGEKELEKYLKFCKEMKGFREIPIAAVEKGI